MEQFSSLAVKGDQDMKTTTSFGVIGLTRDELRAQQLLLNVTRKFPGQADNLVTWLRQLGRRAPICPAAAIICSRNEDSIKTVLPSANRSADNIQKQPSLHGCESSGLAVHARLD